MKKTSNLRLAVAMFALLVGCFFCQISAKAATVPKFTVVTGSPGYMLLNVTGDPSNSIKLTFYPFGASVPTTMDIGYTDANGNFVSPLSTNLYNIVNGTSAYITVNGLQSATVTWPSFTSTTDNNTSLSLNQYTGDLSTGQSLVIYSANAALYSAVSSNAGVASVAISNGQATIVGVAAGSAAINVCSTVGNCNAVNVTVKAHTSPLQLSQSYLAVVVGQGSTIRSYNSSISSASSNSSAAVAYVNNNQVAIVGLSYGQATINVCNTNNVCDAVYVNVQNPSGNSLVLSQNTVTVGVGEKVIVYGLNGSISTVTANSADAIASLNSGSGSNQITVTGVNNGSAIVTACGSSSQGCNVIVVTVQGTPVTNNLSLTQKTVLLNLGQSTSFSSASSTIVTVTSDSENVTAKVAFGQVAITAQRVGQATITACNAVNVCDFVYVTVQDPYAHIIVPAVVSNPVATTITPTLNTSTSNTPKVPAPTVVPPPFFTRLLTVGSVGTDVRMLQNRLIKDGFLKGPITGRFGALTQTALKRFQAKHGITATGSTGQATRTLLNK